MAGKFRTEHCYSAGSWIPYPPPQCLERGLKFILKEFNENVTKSVSGVTIVKIATDLFYNFVSLHPFEDGNGRMARLLFSHTLEKMGVPFPVVFTTGHSRSRSHVIKALKIKDKYNQHQGLFTIAASSVADQWQNFLNYIRFDVENEF